MKNRRLAAAAVLPLALIVMSCFSQTAAAVTFVGGTADWALVVTPTVTNLAFAQEAATTFENHLDVSVFGIVIMVIHNNLGQTVYYSTGTLRLAQGSYGTAYLVETGLPAGTYNASIFAFSTSGIALSNVTTFSFPAR